LAPFLSQTRFTRIERKPASVRAGNIAHSQFGFSPIALLITASNTPEFAHPFQYFCCKIADVAQRKA
jgi:hypothetical protein